MNYLMRLTVDQFKVRQNNQLQLVREMHHGEYNIHACMYLRALEVSKGLGLSWPNPSKVGTLDLQVVLGLTCLRQPKKKKKY